MRVSLFSMSEEKIIQTYRLPGHIILELLEKIKDVMSQSALSTALSLVLKSLMRRVQNHIRFPTNLAARNAIKQRFCNIAEFPNVIGAIDGTHIPLIPPSGTEHVFRNI